MLRKTSARYLERNYIFNLDIIIYYKYFNQKELNFYLHIYLLHTR